MQMPVGHTLGRLNTTTDPDTGGCVVLTGALNDPYTGQTLTFDRARSTIDIDHVVSAPATPSSA